MPYSILGRTIGVCCKRNAEWIPFLESLRDSGFGRVELSLDEAGCSSLLHDAGLVGRVRELLQSLGIGASVHSVGGTNLGEKLSRIRQVSVELVCESVEVADRVGAEWLTVHLGSAGIPNRSADRKRGRLDVAIEALEEILRRTRGSTVRLGLENLPCMPPDWPMCRLGDRSEEFEYVFDGLNSERAGLVFDYGHARLYGGDASREWVERLKERIFAFHLHSNNRLEDLHRSLGPSDAPELRRFVAEVTKVSARAPFLLENYSLEEALESISALRAAESGLLSHA